MTFSVFYVVCLSLMVSRVLLKPVLTLFVKGDKEGTQHTPLHICIVYLLCLNHWVKKGTKKIGLFM